MKTLFLDTAYNQTLGICDERGGWLCLRHGSGQRSSARLHVDLHEMCTEKGITPQDIGEVLYVAGPGFYTGLRVAYGVAQVLKLSGPKTLTLYNHLVPKWLGYKSYSWVTKAYRGEVFVHECHEGREQSGLMAEDKFLEAKLTGDLFIHHTSALDEKMAAKLVGSQSTEGLIQTHIAKLLPLARQHGEEPLYYFRAPEDEFKPNP